MLKKIDLHTHSTCSDGTVTPSGLVTMAKEIGLSAIALTDHDTIAGVSELMEAGATAGLETIPGIELSSSYGTTQEKEIHIVGLFIDYYNQEFTDALDHLQAIRRERNIKMVVLCQQHGFAFTYDEMLSRYKESVITRAHFADMMMEKGYVKSRNEAFERYIGDYGPCFLPRIKMSCQETISLIKKAGGLAILAHPTLYHMGKTELRKLIEFLIASGLDGIEGIYSTYTMGEELMIRGLAKEYGLLLSGGSDYHGANKPHISLGSGKGHLCVPYDYLTDLKNAAGL